MATTQSQSTDPLRDFFLVLCSFFDLTLDS